VFCIWDEYCTLNVFSVERLAKNWGEKREKKSFNVNFDTVVWVFNLKTPVNNSVIIN